MAVAKSYENMEQIGEPFQDNGKMYVRIKGQCKRCGGSGHYSMNAMGDTTCYRCGGSGIEYMNVRWYTDAERTRMDRAAEKRAEEQAVKKEERRIRFAARNAFGFGEAGFITLYKGDPKEISTFFQSFTIDEAGHRAAWYNNLFGWFTPSHMEVPELPETIEAIKLIWDDVRDINDEENLQMKDTGVVKQYLMGILNTSVSEYQGEIGSWLTKAVTVDKNISFSNRYGESHMHIMSDAEGNVYVWTTGSKNFADGTEFTLKMKVKDHKEYNGTKQTIVWYCKQA